jgi:hypothetical protein
MELVQFVAYGADLGLVAGVGGQSRGIGAQVRLTLLVRG